MRILIGLLLIVFASVSVRGQDCCPKPEVEIGFGPQWLFAAMDKDQPILMNEDHKIKQAGFPYSFHLTIRTHPSTLQAGLAIIHDRINLRSKYPVYFPADYPDHIGDSYAEVSFDAFRLGAGAHLRYNFNLLYSEIGIAYMQVISHESTGVIFEAPSGNFFNSTGTIDGKSGTCLRALIGSKFGNGHWNRLSCNLGFMYDTTLRHSRKSESPYWSVHTTAIQLGLNYQLNKIE